MTGPKRLIAAATAALFMVLTPAVAGNIPSFELTICLSGCESIDRRQDPDDYKECVEDCKQTNSGGGTIL